MYIVYFSAAALNDGTITTYPDLYGRDAKVIAALNGVSAPKPKPVVKAKPAQTASR